MKVIHLCNKIIEYFFYSLFLLVPLVFSGQTSELFEFPKMWLTFGLTIIILFSWITKMILQRKIHIQRTPLDIPLALFLLSQIISTVFSLDPYVSLWGYYTRFNGGLLSMLSYLILYYALVSNLEKKHILKLISVSLFSGLLVALWGLPSHFGADPTCYIFRGSFDTSCWTEAFKPTIRIFSTLGQPAWLAAYAALLLPITIAKFLINKETSLESPKKNYENKNFLLLTAYFLLLTILFYASLTFTNTKGGFIAFWIANLAFWSLTFFLKLFKQNFLKYFLICNLTFLSINFFFGIPISQLSKFTIPELSKQFSPQSQINSSATHTESLSGGVTGGTDSGKIRLLVWRGAIEAWKDNKIFGTGVETFAYAYYKYKPVEHNLTSEWDYLYNKAHNEYLNYLTTTGIFGLGSYLAIIGTFLIVSFKKFRTKNFALCTLHFALIASYVSILISNFFGFSVVIINLYFFLIPAFVFILGDFLNPENMINFHFRNSKNSKSPTSKTSALQYVFIAGVFLACCFLLLNLYLYWKADIAYGNGNSLDKAGSYQDAYPLLLNAVTLVNNEPIYRDELSINMATLASAFYLQKDTKDALALKNNAISVSDNLVKIHPNNVVYWKNRVRLYYTLAQGDPDHSKEYYAQALLAINKAQLLAPNDAKISYNVGVLYGQLGDKKKAIEILENTRKLKPDYRDAYFALGLFYNQLATTSDGTVKDPELQKKATANMEHILRFLDPEDKQAKETLAGWK